MIIIFTRKQITETIHYHYHDLLNEIDLLYCTIIYVLA